MACSPGVTPSAPRESRSIPEASTFTVWRTSHPTILSILAPQGVSPSFPPRSWRSVYVATGGSLLVIASPGWDHATPTILNPLLSFFDVRAGDDLVVVTRSTEIADHSITRGLSSVMIKNPNHLDAPHGGPCCIRAGDRNVLVATPFRKGRVVVAAFGQWFLPNTALARPGLVESQAAGHAGRASSAHRPCRSSRGLGSSTSS